MRHYGLGYQETLDLPLSVFWMMNRNLTRLMAEEDLRKFAVAQHAHAADVQAVRAFTSRLEVEIGVTQEVSGPPANEFDPVGWATLKVMSGG
jgi:hypothetical protein